MPHESASVAFPSLILLAAGKSSRMGEPKGLLKCGEDIWIARQLKYFRAAGGEHATVVLGEHAPLYFDVFPEWRATLSNRRSWRGLNLRIIHNEEYQTGFFSSLILGLQQTKNTDWIFVSPIDVPLSESVFACLASARHPTLQVIRPSFENRCGHPVLLHQKFCDALGKLDPSHPDSRLDRQIAALDAHLQKTVTVDDPSIVLNLNTQDDFRNAQTVLL